jgi:hypothetical protein
MSKRQVTGRRVGSSAGEWKPHPEAVQFWLRYFGYPEHPKPVLYRARFVLVDDEPLVSEDAT